MADHKTKLKKAEKLDTLITRIESIEAERFRLHVERQGISVSEAIRNIVELYNKQQERLCKLPSQKP